MTKNQPAYPKRIGGLLFYFGMKEIKVFGKKNRK